MLICIASAQCEATEPDTAERTPNTLLIVADDLGWSDVGYNGTQFYETPNVDALCRSGMRFDMGYTQEPRIACLRVFAG